MVIAAVVPKMMQRMGASTPHEELVLKYYPKY